ncbi:hypothetical protein SAMN05661091_2540 [Paenibacillus uliginis N3/975]|uniref:S1 motif domain-containing protein n=1 Tax=Paenibacillus uliginis N3/975 TaxID=1313296 RepID=A0A1X7HE82_9BACL|nr:hypothetical protein [Paenibacillus uliginis]SMF84181.1 hypothetical protein SAMN05661091_2540 [Paenibacillus uliginis N3/975]
MKYIKANWVEEGESYFFEIDDHGIAYRQMIMKDCGTLQVSIAPDFILSDQQVTVMEGDQEMTPKEFETLWQRAIEPYRAEWIRTKPQYSLGDRVRGTLAMFYPQGVIIRLNNQAYAVTDDRELREQTPWHYLYPGYCIEGIVAGFDETNFWLVLESCVLTGEKVQESILG